MQHSSYFGKVIGGVFGLIMLGPVGLIIGIVLGHFFDKRMRRIGNVNNIAVQEHFFTALFVALGYVCKADGIVTKAEIKVAEQIMQQMRLSLAQREAAMALFRRGRDGDIDVPSAVKQLHEACVGNRAVQNMLLQFLCQASLTNGQILASQKEAIWQIAQNMRYSKFTFEAIVARITAQYQFRQQGFGGQYYQHSQQQQADQLHSLNTAYQVLGVTSSASKQEVKRAYRKLMSQHHPDKLMAKGVPESMMKAATEKAQDIQQAYDTILKQRFNSKH